MKNVFVISMQLIREIHEIFQPRKLPAGILTINTIYLQESLDWREREYWQYLMLYLMSSERKDSKLNELL